MTLLATAGAMALILLPIVLSPGASFTLALGQLFQGARSGPAWVALGTSLGAFTLAVLLGGTGLAGQLASRPDLMHLMGVLGGLALIWMGVRTLWQSGRPTTASRTTDAPGTTGGWATGRSVVGLAYVTVVSNPKALTLYLVIAPTAMPSPNALGYLTFASVHALLVFGWLLGWGAVVTRWPGLLQSGRIQRTLLVGTALYLIFLGVHAVRSA